MNTTNPQRNLHNTFLFGIACATGSLSCTLPIFLVIVGSSLASQDLFDSTIQFVGYGPGMGAILIAVTVGAALFRGAVSRGLGSAALRSPHERPIPAWSGWLPGLLRALSPACRHIPVRGQRDL